MCPYVHSNVERFLVKVSGNGKLSRDTMLERVFLENITNYRVNREVSNIRRKDVDSGNLLEPCSAGDNFLDQHLMGCNFRFMLVILCVIVASCIHALISIF